MLLRTYKHEDIEKCTELFIKVFNAYPWEDKWPSAERANSYLTDIVNTPGFRGFIAVEGLRIVGVCLGNIVKWWKGDEFFIKEMYVDSSVQRKGIGSRLLEYAQESLVKEDIRAIVLLTNQGFPSEEFYTKQEFEKSAEMIFMYKELE
ncbi:MAG: GNAT family N-acetyltransferase [Clostridia bacterium]|nr:GNAT family N-acetyltransferase [Clostridia bacterium]